MLNEVEFAVVDTETTGLSPGRDRVVEIAIVRVTCTGSVINEYSTLVNPDRDMGPTWLHGISAKDVKDAPRFRDICGDIVSLLSGAVFVAHNAAFDWRFVAKEFSREGISVPEVCRICTMHLSRQADPTVPTRRLVDLCKFFAIPLSEGHSALFDARATARLLTTCLGALMLRGARELCDVGAGAESVERATWPAIPPSGRAFPRPIAGGPEETDGGFLARLMSRLPAIGDSTPAIDEYLALLDRAIEDRRISEDEEWMLEECARDTGLVREQVMAANSRYVRDLVITALADGEISRVEMKDLHEVRRLLAISETEFDSIVEECRQNCATALAQQNNAPLSAVPLGGRTICFTGELCAHRNGQRVTREFAQLAAEANGMIVKSGVSRALDYLVVADPDSMSTKARKARELGVRLVAEPVFWRLVGAEVD